MKMPHPLDLDYERKLTAYVAQVDPVEDERSRGYYSAARLLERHIFNRLVDTARRAFNKQQLGGMIGGMQVMIHGLTRANFKDIGKEITR